MSPYNPDAPRIGTADTLKPYVRVDGRTCPRCGARAGACNHMEDVTDVIWLTKPREHNRVEIYAWTPAEREHICDLYRRGLTATQIAEAFNTTRSAIHGILHRMRERR